LRGVDPDGGQLGGQGMELFGCCEALFSLLIQVFDLPNNDGRGREEWLSQAVEKVATLLLPNDERARCV
jgi:hypothetical protein